MPKLTRNFTQGKMNKDLDSRLIPPGQYRDALNIQVATSEGSDVGAVQNILGTTLTTQRKSASIVWQTNLGLGSVNPKIIGIYKDSLNNKIYYFVTDGSNKHAIMEYGVDTNYLLAVISDTRTSGNVLNFSEDYPITGVNILDGILFWTDDLNEPKKINIQRFIEATNASLTDSINATTSIYSRLFKESDITVIKPAPKRAISIDAVSTASDALGYDGEGEVEGLGTGIQPVQVDADFTDANDFALTNGDTISIGWSASQAIGPLSEFNNKDVVLTHEATRSDGTKIKYVVVGTLSSLLGISVGNKTFYTNATLTIISATPDIPSTVLTYDMVLLEDEPIFKNNFPRFSYRWKYEDGEYSTYAPFSKAAFVPGNFEYEPENGFNLGMDDNIRKITLTFPTDTYSLAPADVTEIEILYKGVDSNNVYVLDSHKTSAGSLSTFVIKKDLLGPVVESVQLLRLYDDVPRKAKSQEIIGNRVVYGNYLHNYNLDDSGLIITGGVNSAAFTDGEKYKGLESVKTDRTYQIGVSFLDKFNRESPVFTTKDAAVKLTAKDAEKKNTLQASLAITNPPDWAEYYKYYVKDPAPEYYNVILDRYYNSDDGNIWLSFPSPERNKIREGDYIILKKQHGTDKRVYINNKYKVLDIQNEAPAFIKRTNQAAAVAELKIADVSADVSGKILKFTGPTVTDFEYFVNSLKGGNTIQFRSTDGVKTSEIYKIANGGAKGDANTSNKEYKIELANGTGLTDNDAWITSLQDHSTIEALVYDQTSELLPEFQGKFFVKVPATPSFNEDIADGQRAEEIINVLRSADGITATHTVSSSDLFQKLAYGGATGDSGEPNNGPDDATNEFDLHLYLNRAEDDDISTIRIFPDKELQKTFNDIKKGVRIRFRNSDGNTGKTYLVTNVTEPSPNPYSYNENGFDFTFMKKTVTVDRYFDDDLGADPSELQIVESSLGSVNAVPNPAVFETQPLELADLDIYYEATDALEIGSNGANLSNTVSLDFKNCYTFGNGVESNRIRDDFNAPLLGKGVRVSTVLQTPYAEERLYASLIYSGIMNTRAGVNNSNQFTTAVKITKDLPNTYGSIQKLHARDTNLIALLENKVFSILANKDALFNADGNTNITSSNNVLGQAMPYAGEFGISKNPETFASFGFRAYFTDKARGKVLRLSRDGLTDISSKGMNNFFEDKFRDHTGRITGSYDENMGLYNVHFVGDESIAFKEQVDGWPTRLSYSQPCAVSLNNVYYSINNGLAWKHTNSSNWNTFYGNFYDSSVTFFFNDAADKVKNFKTLSYQGDENWGADITDSLNKGEVTGWKEREGLYFNFIKGTSATWINSSQTGTLDLKDFSVQGIGDIESVSSLTNVPSWEITFAETPNASIQTKGDGSQSGDFGDILYISNSSGKKQVGEILSVTGNVVEVSYDQNVTPVTGDYAFFAKNRIVNTSGIMGFAPKVKMTLAATNARNKRELFAVSSEVFISSE
jgi:hypothetical protein